MSDVLRQTDSQQTAATPNDRAAARDERASAPPATGPGPEKASATAASPVERPGGPDREPGDVMYGSGDMEETEEDTDIEDTAPDMEGPYPGPEMQTAAGAGHGAGIPAAESMHPGMQSGMGAAGDLPGQPGTETVSDTGLMADAAEVHQKWQQIQATFVDDPRGSVEQAAVLADEVLNNAMTAGQQRISDLRNTWDGNGTDTERLRNALRRYRMFIDRLAGI